MENVVEFDIENAIKLQIEEIKIQLNLKDSLATKDPNYKNLWDPNIKIKNNNEQNKLRINNLANMLIKELNNSLPDLNKYIQYLKPLLNLPGDHSLEGREQKIVLLKEEIRHLEIIRELTYLKNIRKTIIEKALTDIKDLYIKKDSPYKSLTFLKQGHLELIALLMEYAGRHEIIIEENLAKNLHHYLHDFQFCIDGTVKLSNCKGKWFNGIKDMRLVSPIDYKSSTYKELYERINDALNKIDKTINYENNYNQIIDSICYQLNLKIYELSDNTPKLSLEAFFKTWLQFVQAKKTVHAAEIEFEAKKKGFDFRELKIFHDIKQLVWIKGMPLILKKPKQK